MKEYENYPLSYVLINNLLMLVALALGYIGMGSYGKIWVAIFAVLWVVLRKVLCTDCWYYDKTCSMGWSNLTRLVFRKNSGNAKLAATLPLFTWMLWFTLVPLATMAYRVWKGALTIDVLGGFIAAVIVFNVAHKKSCCHCKNRKTCAGSMSKN